MKFWSSFDPDYIEKKLVDMKEDVKSLQLWQSSDDLREKFTGILIEVSHDKCELKLDNYSKAYGRLNVQQALYVHEVKDDALFKKDIFSFENNNLVFKTPTEVKFRDQRVSERFYYKYQDYKDISFRLENFEDAKIHSHILTDISTAGLSFVLPQKDRELLNVGDSIFINNLTDQTIPDQQEAKVVYVTPFQMSRESDTKLIQVGVHFEGALDSVSYKSIGSVVKKKQEKVKGLDTDKFNGLNPDEFNKTIKKVRRENPTLAANIIDRVEDIDRLRYLTIEMKREFLLSVNHDLLAAALRLSSKELIFDLLSEVTDSFREEFLEKLDVPKPASAVNKAQDKICKFIKEKEKTGELVLDPRSFVQMV